MVTSNKIISMAQEFLAKTARDESGVASPQALDYAQAISNCYNSYILWHLPFFLFMYFLSYGRFMAHITRMFSIGDQNGFKWAFWCLFDPFTSLLCDPVYGVQILARRHYDGPMPNLKFTKVYVFLFMLCPSFLLMMASHCYGNYRGYLVGIEPNPGPNTTFMDPAINSIRNSAVWLMDYEDLKNVYGDMTIRIRPSDEPYANNRDKYDYFRFKLHSCSTLVRGVERKFYGFLSPKGFIYLFHPTHDIWFHTACTLFGQKIRSNVFTIERSDITVCHGWDIVVRPLFTDIPDAQSGYVGDWLSSLLSKAITSTNIEQTLTEQINEAMGRFEDVSYKLMFSAGLVSICVGFAINGIYTNDKIKITAGVGGLVLISTRLGITQSLRKLIDYLSGSGVVSESAHLSEICMEAISSMISNVTGVAKQASGASKYLLLLNSFNAACKNLPDIVSWFCDAFEDILNFFWHSMLKQKRLSIGFNKDAELTEWIRSLHVVFDENDAMALPINGENARRIQRLLARGRSFLLESEHLPRTLLERRKRVTTSYLHDLGKLFEPYKSAMVYGQDLRMEPLAIFINGAPGTGKTLGLKFLIEQIIGKCLSNTNTLSDDSLSDNIFMRAAEGKYWSGYRNQFAVVFDDFGQAKDVAGNPDNEYMDLIRAVSMFGNPLHMAAIAEKGTTFFTSELILATSNLRNFRAVNSINCREALERRFKVNVTLCPAVGFCIDEDVPWQERRLDLKKMAAYNVAKGLPEGFFCTEAYQFRKFLWPSQIKGDIVSDATEPIYTGEILNWNEFLLFVVDEYENQKRKFSDIVDSAQYFRDQLRSEREVCAAQSQEEEEVDLFLDAPCLYCDDVGYGCDCGAGLYTDYACSPPMKLVHRLSPPAFMQITELLFKYGESRASFAAITFLAKWGRNRRTYFENEKWIGGNGVVSEVELYVKSLSEWYAKELSSHPMLALTCCLVTNFAIIAGVVHLVKKMWPSASPTYRAALATFSVVGRSRPNFTHSEDLDTFMENGSIPQSWPEEEKDVATVFLSCLANGYGESPKHKLMIQVSLFDSLLELRETRMRCSPILTNIYPKSNRVENMPVAESGVDKNGYEIMKSLRKFSQYELHVGDVKLGYVTFVKDRWAILPAHFLIGIRNKLVTYPETKVYLVAVATHVCYPLERGFVSSLNIGKARLGNSDVALVEFPKYIRGHANQLDKFVSSLQELSEIRKLDLVLTVNSKEETKQFASVGRYFEGEMAINVSGAPHYSVSGFIEYIAETSAGDCGSIIWRHDKSVNTRKLLGFHIAAFKSANISIATIVTQDMIRDKIANSIEHLDLGNPDAQCGFAGPFVPLCTLSSGLRSGNASSLRKSVFFNKIWKSQKAPAHLRPFEKDGVAIDPMANALARFDRELVIIDDEYVKLAADSVYSDISDAERVPVISRVYTFEDAVVGIPGDPYVNGIPRNTSPGWPKVEEVSPAFPGKTLWFGNGVEYDLTRPQCVALKQECEKVISDALLGIRNLHVFSDHLKDEKVSHKKVAIGKTRLFCGSPLVLLVCLRMFFLDFVANMMRNRIANGSAVGVNPYKEWGILYDALNQFSPNVIAGDFSSFDVSQTSQLLWGVYSVISRWYTARGATVEESRVREVLWEEVVNSVHINGKFLYMWVGSLPSGLALTTIVNTIYNNMVVKIAFFIGSGNNYSMFKNIRKYVRPIAYGDDGIMTVNSSVLCWFNQDTLERYLATIGMVYTDEQKGDASEALGLSIFDRNFLKRSFRFSEELGGAMCAPLDINSISEMIQWTKKGPFEYTTQCSNVDFVLRELSLHGMEVYETFAPLILDISHHDLKYYPTVTNYLSVLKSTRELDLFL